MSEKDMVEIYGIKVDSACAALLDVALHGVDWTERRHAIDRLAVLGCNLSLGIVAKKGVDWTERKYAMDRIRR
jgi:hypothetical protein